MFLVACFFFMVAFILAVSSFIPNWHLPKRKNKKKYLSPRCAKRKVFSKDEEIRELIIRDTFNLLSKKQDKYEEFAKKAKEEEAKKQWMYNLWNS
jgi:hypothetical protein